MALIANLDISIGVSTKRLRVGLKKVNGLIDGALGGFKRVGGGIAAAFNMAQQAMGPVVQQFQEASARVAQLGKDSDRLNLATESLEGLALAARSVGVEYDTVTDLLNEMNMKLGEAQAGEGTAAAALEELGLSVKELSMMDADQAFLTIQQGLNGVENAARRAFLAEELFAGAGTEAAAMLAMSSEQLSENTALLEKFGLATTREGAAGVSNMNKAWGKFMTVAEAAVNVMTAEIAPVLEALGEMLFDVGEDGLDLGQIIRDVVRYIQEWIGFAVDAVSVFAGAWHLLRSSAFEVFAALVRGIKWVVSAIDSAAESLGMDVVGEGVMQTLDAIESDFKAKANELRQAGFEAIQSGLNREGTRELDRRVRANKEANKEIAEDAAEQRKKNRESAAEIDAVTAAANPFQQLQVGAAGFGTQAAASAINKPGMDAAAVAKKTLDETKKQTNALESIDASLRENNQTLIPLGV